MNKAIVSTSAYPFHFGHKDLYRHAVELFGIKNVKVVIGKNHNKNCDFSTVNFHMTPYGIPFEIAENITLSDYCEKNGVNYMIRGIRNNDDVNYELTLNYINKELKPGLKTIFFASDEKLSNISSILINELLRYKKFETVKKFMNEDAMYRFFYRKPEFIVFFGKSCNGKTTYISNNYKNKFINIDSIFWDVFELCFGEKEAESVKKISYELIYNGEKIDRLINNYSNEKFWLLLLDFIRNNYEKFDFSDKGFNYKGYIVDFSSIGCYWKTIPSKIRSLFYLIKIKTNNRKEFISNKKFDSKIHFLDYNYKDPDYFDNVIVI